MDTLFYLHKKGYTGAEDRAFPLMCRIHLGKKDGYQPAKRIEFPLNVSIKKSEWDVENEKVKKSNPKHLVVNQRINEIKTQATSFVNKKAFASEVDLFAELKNHFKPPKNTPPNIVHTPVQWITDYLERKKSVLSAGTIKNYRNVLNKLITYQVDSQITITWDMIDYAFLERFTLYLVEKYKCENSYTQKIVKTVKDFISASLNEGFLVNMNYKQFNPTYLDSDSDHIALSLDELRKLVAIDLTDSPRMSISRDLFVFMCLLGLRYSDLKQIRKEHIKYSSNNTAYLEFRQKKTGDLAYPLLHEKALEIWEKYDYNFAVPSDVEINRTIKQVAELAGISDLEVITRKIGNETTTQTVSRSELISCHTARRTYVTLQTNIVKMPTELLSKLTGHNNIEMTKHYDKAKIDFAVERASEFIGKLKL